MRQLERWHLMVAALLLVAWLASACGPAASTPVPTAPPAAPAARGRCGDGVCDEAERADPSLCPQDCAPQTQAQAATSPTVPPPTVPPSQPAPTRPTSGGPDYEPPINVFFVLHLDPSGELGAPTFKAQPVLYQRAYDEIQWLIGEASRYGVKMTALFNGWYTRWALDHNDLDQFGQLVAAGHEVGTHAHATSYDPGQDLWLQYGQEAARYGLPAYDAEKARQAWSDADQYMEAALSAAGLSGQNRTMCAWPLLCSDEGLMMEQFGFDFASGNRSEKGPLYFDHIVWNPWRPGTSDEPGYELEADPDAGFVALDHYAQIGASEEAHAGIDVTPAGLKRSFLMLYAEWLSRVRRGAEDRVWTFGFIQHPNYSDRYNADISDVLSWLDRYFIGKTTPQGHTIARYATVSEIGEEYLAWEQAHPGALSFSFVRGDVYPYTYAGVPAKLDGAKYEAHVDLGVEVTCFRFSKDGRPLYLLWSDDGERTVDLRELSGQVRVTGPTGQESIQDAAALPLTEEPLFVERQ
jgi:hypothetical protein